MVVKSKVLNTKVINGFRVVIRKSGKGMPYMVVVNGIKVGESPTLECAKTLAQDFVFSKKAFIRHILLTW